MVEKAQKVPKKVGLIATHLMEMVVINHVDVDPAKNAKNTLHVDQLRVLVKRVERVNHGAKKENLRKMRNCTWI